MTFSLLTPQCFSPFYWASSWNSPFFWRNSLRRVGRSVMIPLTPILSASSYSSVRLSTQYTTIIPLLCKSQINGLDKGDTMLIKISRSFLLRVAVGASLAMSCLTLSAHIKGICTKCPLIGNWPKPKRVKEENVKNSPNSQPLRTFRVQLSHLPLKIRIHDSEKSVMGLTKPL